MMSLLLRLYFCTILLLGSIPQHLIWEVLRPADQTAVVESSCCCAKAGRKCHCQGCKNEGKPASKQKSAPGPDGAYEDAPCDCPLLTWDGLKKTPFAPMDFVAETVASPMPETLSPPYISLPFVLHVIETPPPRSV